MSVKRRRKYGGLSNHVTSSRRNLTRTLKSAEVSSLNGTLMADNNQTEIDLNQCRYRCVYPSTVCRKITGTYKCLCLYNGKFLEPGEECVPTTFTDGGVISGKDIAELNQQTVNPLLTTQGPLNSTNSISRHSSINGGQSPMSITIIATSSTFTLILFIMVLLCYLTKRCRKRQIHRNYGQICNCFWQKPKSHLGLQALAKTNVLENQQFTTNPNYYSSPPEMGILTSLIHLEISADRLTFLNVIGEGCFGKVYKGVYKKTEDEICNVAIKILKENSSNEIQLDFLREVEIMSSFDHENILALVGVVFMDNASSPWMVFEFMEYGDLAVILRENTPNCYKSNTTECKITISDLPWLAKQVADGMNYLSAQHFVHRDLATRNCLVGKGPIIKISDFGMSRDIYTCDYYKIGGSRMLPVRWMAPESVMYGKFTLETDVWSFGVVLWEIFAYGKQPYYGHSNEEVVKLIRQGILLSPPEECPYYVCQLMEMCWKTNPYDRIKFQTICEILNSKCKPKKEIIINSILENGPTVEISR
ncbi:hypothetical protein CHUAL_002242 [Chamberlinius hualienensis]